MKLERRVLPASQSELRLVRQGQQSQGLGQLVGYAAVFNKFSEDLGGFREFIRPGAFSLNKDPDVRALINHDPNLLLGRTRSGTLRLSTDRRGLRVECDLADTSYARDYATCVGRRDMTGMSFGFITRNDAWSERAVDGQLCLVRELIDVDLFDVSGVTFPAYPDTELGLRSLNAWKKRSGWNPQNELLRMRLQLLELES